MDKESTNRSSDLTGIDEYNRQLAAATSEGDLATIERLICDDHVTLAPDQPPVVGRVASMAIMRDALMRFHVTEVHRPTRTEVDKTLAYQWGEFTVSLAPKSGGPTLFRSGKYLRIYRRRADHVWMMIVDSFSADHPDGGWDEILSTD